ncbi:long-chain fatty acid--CoA ligase [Geovibrio thiophilus]|uniref:Long-chain fatty acid--CoA ligase n=1 Tax=Geovibrio thiophilus TaxID=139438 RepID=A0A3R5UYV2_9BACT|nr:long-chain fatty acid--CoA ligase [Geovibrio thiophilus]QAR33140.1 long-chain fatty acid--CoA ligase [Geovibrio thiophilus]
MNKKNKNPETLFHSFIQSVDRHKNNTAFIYRSAEQEHKVTFEKLFEDVLLLSRSFAEKKIVKDTRVLLLSDNRYSWIVTDLALVSLGAISVPRGSECPEQELSFIMEHSGCEFIIFETEKLYDDHKAFVNTLERVKGVFIMEGEHRHKIFSRIYTYNDLLTDRTISDEDIARFRARKHKLFKEDVFTLIYTSGTTGVPKGVMLTHDNIMYNLEVIPWLIALRPDDTWLSILPTWHIFERAAEYAALMSGCCTIYSSIKTFSADLEHYKPTIVATVPRLWESMYTKVNAALEKQGKTKHRIFTSLVAVSAAYKRNKRRLKGHLPVFEKEPKMTKLINDFKAFAACCALYPLNLLAAKKLKAVQAKFGGRMRLAISGGGSLPQYLDEWIDALGIRIINAYGMTECAPAIAGRALNCEIFGTLGPAVGNTLLRITDDENRPLPAGVEGEIQVKGRQVMPGYYDNDEENEKTFTADGYLKTGDLGKLTRTGELVITGRIKEIIVLANGENIDPSRIESTITKLPFVKDAVLVGQDRKGLGALIVPDLEKLKEAFLPKIENMVHDAQDMLKDSRVIEQAKREINKLLNAKKGFKPHEKVHNIHFMENDFEPGKDLTNTLKKKRHAIEKRYQSIIQKLFGKD